MKFKDCLIAHNFENLFKLKIQFTQKKELVVNNNTIMEFDFTKKDTDNFSAEMIRQNMIGMNSHHMMTPDTVGPMMYYSNLQNNNNHKFMTPNNIQKNNLTYKETAIHSLSLTGNPGGYGNQQTRMTNRPNSFLFKNMQDTNKISNYARFFANPQLYGNGYHQKQINMHGKEDIDYYNNINPFHSAKLSGTKDSFTEDLIKRDVGSRISSENCFEHSKPKKSLSLKERRKLKNKQKNVPELNKNVNNEGRWSADSKITVKEHKKETKKEGCNNLNLIMTEKKEREKTILVSDCFEKLKIETIPKHSVIINPNIIKNNFSFGKENHKLVGGKTTNQNRNQSETNSKKSDSQKNSSYEYNKEENAECKMHDAGSPFTDDNHNDFSEKPNFSLSNLNENVSNDDESIEEKKLNIFRVFHNVESLGAEFESQRSEGDCSLLGSQLFTRREHNNFDSKDFNSIENQSKEMFARLNFEENEKVVDCNLGTCRNDSMGCWNTEFRNPKYKQFLDYPNRNEMNDDPEDDQSRQKTIETTNKTYMKIDRNLYKELFSGSHNRSEEYQQNSHLSENRQEFGVDCSQRNAFEVNQMNPTLNRRQLQDIMAFNSNHIFY